MGILSFCCKKSNRIKKTAQTNDSQVQIKEPNLGTLSNTTKTFSQPQKYFDVLKDEENVQINKVFKKKKNINCEKQILNKPQIIDHSKYQSSLNSPNNRKLKGVLDRGLSPNLIFSVSIIGESKRTQNLDTKEEN